MKRQKSFEQKLSSVVLLSLFSVGIFPTVTSASEELNSNGEIGPISLENIVISEENHLIPDISETSQTINSIPVEELTNPENQIIWSDLDLTQSEINSENEEKQSRIIELENQLKNYTPIPITSIKILPILKVLMKQIFPQILTLILSQFP
jgi:hypothetical protein